MQRIIVIGGGIGGLATAAMFGKAGYQVTVVEKNHKLGGRANVFSANGFRFDMGPSWYLMPDVFEHFYKLMGTTAREQLDLQQLDPSYQITFRESGQAVRMHSDVPRDGQTFEGLEPGSSRQLIAYLEQSKYQYDIAIENFMYKNYDSVFDFFNRKTLIEGRRLHVLENMHRYVSRYFKNEQLRKIMEYQLVFLGSSPYNTPALYNIMSHIDFNMGVFYPKGGIYAVVESLVSLGKQHGVTYTTGTPVQAIEAVDKAVSGIVLADGTKLPADIVISNADIQHTDTELLPKQFRMFNAKYWHTRTLAPSAFIMYLGLKQKVPSLVHHNLVFGEDWRQGFREIFDTPQWPSDPSYYICAPSIIDPSVAPEGKENLFVLVPVAPGIDMDERSIADYRQRVLALLERDLHIPALQSLIDYERIYTSRDFSNDYNAFGGSALGLAHTLRQTAIFRPNNINRKLRGMYYVGGGTNPGIGMPICLISAELAYKRITGNRTAAPLQSL